MQLLLDAYAVPTATLAAPALAELAAGVVQRIATVDALEIDRRVIDAAYGALTQVEPPAAPATHALVREGLAVAEQPLTVQGQGYLVVTRICDGWGAYPVPDYGNGFMALTVGFTELGVDPVIWGTLSLCRYKLGERVIQLDGIAPDPRTGDVRVYIGRNIAVAGFGTFPDPVLVELVAQVFVDGVEVAGQLSFKVDLNTRRIELLVPLAGGHVIAAVDPSRVSVVHVRASNGAFECDVAAQRCLAPDGSSIGAP
jgi:hypothetical protein